MGNMTTKEILQGIKGWADDKFAAKDGYYEQMSVGLAKNLEGTDDTSGSFIERTSGGDAEISTGQALLTGIEGNANQWNQLVQNPNFSNNAQGWSVGTNTVSVIGDVVTVTMNQTQSEAPSGIWRAVSLVNGHKYYVSCSLRLSTSDFSSTCLIIFGGWQLYGSTGTQYITVEKSTERQRLSSIFDISNAANNSFGVRFYNVTTQTFPNSFELSNPKVIDLTLMFGSDAQIAAKLGITQAQITTEVGIAAFEQWLKDNVGLRAYYPYDAGSLLSVKMNKLTSVGYNLLDPTTKKAHLLGDYDDTYDNKYGIVGTYTSIQFTDVYGNISNPIVASDGSFSVDGKEGDLLVNGAGNDCAVFMWYDGTKTEYEPYQKESRDIDVTGITGINPNTGTRETIFPDGLKGIGSIKDFLGLNENGETIAIKKIGSVDLGTLNWVYGSVSPNIRFYVDRAALPSAAKQPSNMPAKILCGKYEIASTSNIYSNSVDKCIGLGNSDGEFINCHDSSYTSAASFKTAMSGVYLFYPLETPITYTDLQDASGNALEFPLTFWSDNWGTETIEPLNDSTGTTMIAPTISAQYSMDAVEAIKTLQDTVEEIQDTLDTKADVDGVYKDMVVGTAQNLEGNQIVSEPFMFRTAGGDIDFTDGNAQALEIKGDSVAVNQLVQNGDFSNGTTGWQLRNGVGTVSNGVISLTGASGTAAQIRQNIHFLNNHKYYTSFYIKTDDSTKEFYLYLTKIADWTTQGSLIASNRIYPSTNWGKYSSVVTMNDNYEYLNTTQMWSAYTVELKNIIVIDLTQMGLDSLTTAAQVEEWLASHVGLKSYYPYNTGSLLNCQLSGLDSIGFNQWDGEKDDAKIINATNGVISNNEATFVTDYVPVIGGNTYSFNGSTFAIGSGSYGICYYDQNKNYIGGHITSEYNVQHFEVAIPQGVSFIRASGTLSMASQGCINLSWDGTRNGEYEPYQKNSLSLPVTTLTGINPNTGERETIFPNGMRGAGSVKDRIYIEGGVVKAAVNVGSVDLGSLSDWAVNTSSALSPYFYAKIDANRASFVTGNLANAVCSKYPIVRRQGGMADKVAFGDNDATYAYIEIKDSSITATTSSGIASALSGIILNYELATPIIYTDIQLSDGTPFTLPKSIQVSNWGTEMIQPQNPSDGTALNTCAPTIDLKYAIDAVEAIDTLQNDGIMVVDLKSNFNSFLTALNQALNGIGTISISQNPTDKTYAFTFTASQS